MLVTSRRWRIFLVCCAVIMSMFLLDYNIWIRKDYAHVKTGEDLRESQEISSLSRKMPNLPVKFWYDRRHFKMTLNRTCAKFPDIMNLNLVHEHWQLLVTTKGRIKLHGAYLDDRTTTNTVRVLTMIDRRSPLKMDTWCQLWFHDSRTPEIVPVEEYFYLWHEKWQEKNDGEFQPYLLSCSLPSELSYAIPSSVSIVENFCDNANNSLRVIYEKPARKNGFAVCSKGLNFVEDITVRLVEWIELLLLFGVEKIYIFDILTTPQVQHLYEYYTARGVLDVTPLRLSDVQVNDPYVHHLYLEHGTDFQYEVIPLNQCFLQHMYKYEYISVMDTDEVIVPKRGLITWREMINSVNIRAKEEGVTPGSYIARNCYFFDNSTIESVKSHFPNNVYEGIRDTMAGLGIPEYMHMSQRMFKSKNCTRPNFYIKSIHSTDCILAVHNHFHLKTLDPKRVNFHLDFDEAFMHHYRNGCTQEMRTVCYNDYQRHFEYDDSILKYYVDLKENVIRTLDVLGYF